MNTLVTVCVYILFEHKAEHAVSLASEGPFHLAVSVAFARVHL